MADLDPKGASPYRRIGVWMSLAAEMAGTVLAALWFGNWLDERYATSPWLLVTVVSVASVGAFWRLIWIGRREMRRP